MRAGRGIEPCSLGGKLVMNFAKKTHTELDRSEYSSSFDLGCRKPHGLPRGFCRGLNYQVFPRGFPCG